MITNFLPDFEPRTAPIDTLVFHCLAFDAQKGIESLRQNGVSAHYLIAPNGRIFRLIDEKNCAYHAGKSFWREQEHINQTSVGIELCSPTLGQEPYNQAQIYALIRLSHRLIRKYHIRPDHIVGHSDIAPTRKSDPGKAFPWAYLARHGIGLWPNGKSVEIQVPPSLTLSNTARLLAQIGYDTSVLSASLTAFCRRFMPEMIETYADLAYLLEHPYDTDFLPINHKKFLQTLCKVSALYRSNVLCAGATALT